MKNLSLKTLFLSNIHARSPLISFMTSYQRKKLSVYDSSFKRFSKPFLISHGNSHFSANKVRFDSFLSSVINIQSIPSSYNNNYENIQYSSNQQLNISDSYNFTSCTFIDIVSATTNGGAITLNSTTNAQLDLLLSYCNFSGCISSSGAAVYSNVASSLIIEYCVFEDCNCSVHGGAVYAENSLYFSMTYSSFFTCVAKVNGGALCLSNTIATNSMPFLCNIYFSNCSVVDANGLGNNIYFSTNVQPQIRFLYVKSSTSDANDFAVDKNNYFDIPSSVIYYGITLDPLQFLYECFQTPSPSPSPSMSISPSASPTPSISMSPSPSLSPSPSISSTPTPSSTPSQSPSPSPTASLYPTQTPTPSMSPYPSPTPSQSASPSPSLAPTQSPTPSESASPSPTISRTAFPTTLTYPPTHSPTPSSTGDFSDVQVTRTKKLLTLTPSWSIFLAIGCLLLFLGLFSNMIVCIEHLRNNDLILEPRF